MFKFKWFLIVFAVALVVFLGIFAAWPRVSVNASGTVGISLGTTPPQFDIVSISDIPAYGVIEPSGCGEFKGRVKIRIDCYLKPESSYYDQYGGAYVPVVPLEGYLGKVDPETGEPLDWDDYNKWWDSLPTVWQESPFHSHFVYYDTAVLDDTIKSKIAEVTEYFYAFHLYCWDNDYTFLSQWVKVPKRAGTIRDVFIAGDSSPLNKDACELKAVDIVSRTPDFDTRTFEQSPVVPPPLNIGEKGTIEIGGGATNRSTYANYTNTYVDLNVPATGTGTLDTFQIYVHVNSTGVKIGTFYGSAPDFTPRDYETIGSVNTGAPDPDVFTGLSCDATLGDYIGTYGTDGSIERDSSGAGNYYKSGDQFDAGTQTYTTLGARTISLYGTGTEGGGGPEITNTQSTWGIGVVGTSAVVYFSADGSQDDDYSQIENTGSVAVDIEIQGTDIEGGSYDWVLASSNGDQQYSLYANSEGSPTVYDIEVKSSSYNDLITNLAVSDTYDWSMKFTAPSAFNASDDGAQKSATVTLVASEHT